MKIILIVAYFGEFSNYFDLWLQSCRNNPTIDWLFVTDNRSDVKYPENFRVIYKTFEQMRQLVQSNFDFPISLKFPYKLCDYKICYGLFFKEEIKDYDFWGFCDVDLIFGNIRHFLTDKILNKYDRLFIYGHLTLLRNSEEITSRFKVVFRNVDYKNAFTEEYNVFFEEGPGTSSVWVHLWKDKLYEEVVFDDIYVKKKHFISVQKQTNGSDLYKQNFIFTYCDGSLLRWYIDKRTNDVHSEETLYVHLQKRRMRMTQITDVNRFAIIPNSFISLNSYPDLSFLRKYGRKYLFYGRRIRKIGLRLLGYVKNI